MLIVITVQLKTNMKLVYNVIFWYIITYVQLLINYN